MNTIETFEHNGYTVELIQDEDAESPRHDDNAGRLVCFHGRYQLGDEHSYNPGGYSGWGELQTAIEAKEGPFAVCLPLALIDHSGISLVTVTVSGATEDHDQEFEYAHPGMLTGADLATVLEACGLLAEYEWKGPQ